MRLAGQIGIDAAVAGAALALAFALRFDGAIPAAQAGLLYGLLPVVAVGKTLINYLLKNYRQIWQYTGLREAESLVVGSFLATLALVLVRLVGAAALPYSVIVLDGLLYLMGVLGVRFIRRLQADYGKGRRGPRPRREPRTLLLGAGDTANTLLRNLQQVDGLEWNIVGLLDDSPAKQGMELNGYPVLAPTTQLEQMIDAEEVQHVVIAMPSAPSEVLRNLISRAQARGATVRVAPRMVDLIENGPPQNGRHQKGQHQNGHAPNGQGKANVTIADLADSAEVKKTLLGQVGRRERENTVLVTGGAGYIGSLLVRKLLENGYTVRVLDNFTFGAEALRPLLEHPRLDVVQGDIASIRDVSASVKDVGTVVALAAIVGDPACGLNPEETLALNYESTKVLVEACNFYGVGRLVFASSCSVYGASDHNVLTETSKLNPVSLYARTRILSENVIFDRCGDVVPVVLRIATVFGLSPRMRYDLVVNSLTARAIIDGKIQIFGGSQQRPFIHCQDAAEAFRMMVGAPADKVRGEVFNVGGNGLNYTILEAGQLVADVVGGVEIEMVGDVEDPRNYRVSCDKIRTRIGFEPGYDLRTGIEEMCRAIDTTPHLRNYNDPLFSNVKSMQGRMEAAGLLVRSEF